MRILVLLLSSVLIVSGAEIVFLGTSELPGAVVNRSYSPPPLRAQSSGGCAAGGIGFQIVSGEFPPGIMLSAAGYFTGKPASTGIYSVVVRASNGCAWSTRRFALSVSTPPTLMATPSIVRMRWKEGEGMPASTLVLSSSWTDVVYDVRVLGDWLEAIPEQGRVTRNGSLASMDVIALRPRLGDRWPGVFTATLEIRAWQAEPLRVPVELIVD